MAGTGLGRIASARAGRASSSPRADSSSRRAKRRGWPTSATAWSTTAGPAAARAARDRAARARRSSSASAATAGWAAPARAASSEGAGDATTAQPNGAAAPPRPARGGRRGRARRRLPGPLRPAAGGAGARRPGLRPAGRPRAGGPGAGGLPPPPPPAAARAGVAGPARPLARRLVPAQPGPRPRAGRGARARAGPGEGFGPAAHATTAMCLEALEALPAGPALDAGCGSGLLAQAWARLGRGPVLACDLDPRALDQAARSLAAAGLAGRVTLRRAALGALRPRRSPAGPCSPTSRLAAHRELLGRVGAAAGGAPVGAAAGARRPPSRPRTGPRPGAGRMDGARRLRLPRAGGAVSRVWRTWAVLVLFALGTSLITPLIPLYQDELGFGDTVVTLFLGCYVITLVPSMLSLGQLSDRIGRKRVLLIAIATLAVAQAILIAEPPLRAAGGAGDPGPGDRRLLRHLHRLPGRRRPARSPPLRRGAGLDLDPPRPGGRPRHRRPDRRVLRRAPAAALRAPPDRPGGSGPDRGHPARDRDGALATGP